MPSDANRFFNILSLHGISPKLEPHSSPEPSRSVNPRKTNTPPLSPTKHTTTHSRRRAQSTHVRPTHRRCPPTKRTATHSHSHVQSTHARPTHRRQPAHQNAQPTRTAALSQPTQDQHSAVSLPTKTRNPLATRRNNARLLSRARKLRYYVITLRFVHPTLPIF